MNISVIIPAYNVEKYIERSINSALNQKFSACEIIVIDDGSTDQTASIVNSFKERIVYIYQENAGSSSARNLGIKNAKGNWIAFLDSDDEWVDTHLDNFVKTAELYPQIKWYGAPFKVVNENTKKQLFKVPKYHLNKKIPHVIFKDYMRAFPPQAYLSSPTMVIDKLVFDRVGFFDITKKTAEDVDMWFRIGLEFPEIGYTHKEGAVVYRRDFSLSTSRKWNPSQSIDRFKEAEKLALSKSKTHFERAKPRLAYWVNKIIYSSVRENDLKVLKELKTNFGAILSVKYRLILFVTTTFPFSLRLIQLIKRS